MAVLLQSQVAKARSNTLRSVVSNNRCSTCDVSLQREVAETKVRTPTVYDCVQTKNALVSCGIRMSTLPSTFCGYSWTGLPVVRNFCSFVEPEFEQAKHLPMCPSVVFRALHCYWVAPATIISVSGKYRKIGYTSKALNPPRVFSLAKCLDPNGKGDLVRCLKSDEIGQASSAGHAAQLGVGFT